MVKFQIVFQYHAYKTAQWLEWHKKNICEYLKLNSQGFANLKLLSKLLKKQCKNQIFFQN